MSDTAPLSAQTEKDQKVLDQRRSDFANGYARRMEETTFGYTMDDRFHHAMKAAKAAFPDPPQPREIILSEGSRFRCVNDALQIDHNGKWVEPMFATTENVRALYDLLNNPWEVSHG